MSLRRPSVTLAVMLALTLACASCARTFGLADDAPPADQALDEAAPDAAPGADLDARGPDLVAPADGKAPDAPPAKRCDWTAPFAIATPQPLNALNTKGFEADPFLSPDGLTLCFGTYTRSPTGIWSTTRPNRDADFTAAPTPAPQTLFIARPAEAVQHLMITPDGQLAVVHTLWVSSLEEIWIGQRSTASGALSFDGWKLALASDPPGPEYDPHLSADGLTLYYQRDIGGQASILISTRANTTQSFPAGTALALSTTGNQSPSLTADQLTLVYTACGGGECRLYYATRASDADAFGPAKAVPGIDAPGIPEVDPFVSADGCELFFARIISGRSWDLYHARISQP